MSEELDDYLAGPAAFHGISVATMKELVEKQSAIDAKASADEVAPDDVVKRLREIPAMIGKMCGELRPPLMSIPVDHVRDEDVRIVATVKDAADLIETLLARLKP